MFISQLIYLKLKKKYLRLFYCNIFLCCHLWNDWFAPVLRRLSWKYYFLRETSWLFSFSFGRDNCEVLTFVGHKFSLFFYSFKSQIGILKWMEIFYWHESLTPHESGSPGSLQSTQIQIWKYFHSWKFHEINWEQSVLNYFEPLKSMTGVTS